MSKLVYGDCISRVRTKLKAASKDDFITDRDIWSLYKPWLNQVAKELDSKNKLMGFVNLFQTLDVVPLIEVDRVEAGCIGMNSGHTIMRTEDPVNELFSEGYWGTMIRSITSLDRSQELQPITPSGYDSISKSKNFKYNKYLYYWTLNDYIYFPQITWKAVTIEALTEGDISKYKCNSDEKCLPFQKRSLNMPDYILSRVESLLFQSLGISFQLPEDNSPDGVPKSAL